MKLALGTVQLGLPYGVANPSGQVSRDEACAILKQAWSSGIDTLDTAIAYGESEKRLGDFGVGEWRVVTKLPAVPEGCPDIAGWVRENVAGSLNRLKLKRLYGLLLHRSQQLLSPAGRTLYQALAALKDENKIEKIGVSIYDPEELDALCPGFDFDLVQAPFNVFDRRIATSGWLKRLHEAGAEVHVRSAFLQGLLLLTREVRPAAFGRWQPLWDRWDAWLADRSVTPLQACLGFVLSRPAIDRVVVGVDSVKQLREMLASVETAAPMPPDDLMNNDSDLINPSRWNAS
jgi:aryl-alcohol dehydrogenase-like predicted oxidoreductase